MAIIGNIPYFQTNPYSLVLVWRWCLNTCLAMATTNSSCRFTALASGKEVQQPKLLFPHGSALIDTPMIPNSCFCMYVIYIYIYVIWSYFKTVCNIESAGISCNYSRTVIFAPQTRLQPTIGTNSQIWEVAHLEIGPIPYTESCKRL